MFDSPTPAQAHARNVAAGFNADPVQAALARRLTALRADLTAAGEVPNGLSRLLRRRQPVTGLYLWGGVGRGKTYLLDLFHESLPFADKQRLHFHRFMHRVHADLRAFAGRPDPLEAVAERFAGEARVLCFDEFFVSDIGDAMILAGLLHGLFSRGVTMVATSNIAPGRLYENGLQRRRFRPAIGLIERHMQVVHVGGETDYRLQVLRRDGLYRTDGNAAALFTSFQALGHARFVENQELMVNDRPIVARYCAEDVVWFDFPAICDGPRSADDYIELARLFSTVVVDGVPVFDTAKEDQARRFISLIDEFYDRNVNVLLSAAAPLRDLYQGRRFVAEFERTRSRISEMQGDEYLHRTHRP